MLTISRLRKFYGDFLALDDVSFQVRPGEVVGFLGPNGAGKSTTMKIVAGFTPASSGAASIDGLDVARYPIEARRRIGYLPEHTPLYRDMRVREFLSYRARIKGVPRRQVASRVDYVLERAWLTDRTHQLIDTLSKGYRQRVGIADALVGNPRLLMLDEPTIGLDPNQIRDVRELIKELGEAHTIVLSTHILVEVEMVCDRVVIVDRGRTVADDTVAGLVERHRENRIAAAVRADDTLDNVTNALAAVEGVVAVEPLLERSDGTLLRFDLRHDPAAEPAAVAERVSRRVTERGWALAELTPQRTTLESVFVHLTLREREPAASEDAA